MSRSGTALFFGVGAYSFAVATVDPQAAAGVWSRLRRGGAGADRLRDRARAAHARIRIAYFAVVMLGLNEITKTIVANVKAIGSSLRPDRCPACRTAISATTSCSVSPWR